MKKHSLILLAFLFVATFAFGQHDNNTDVGFGDDRNPAAYRTQTIGGWGAKPRGNNPGAFLHEHFDKVFPNGITIGSEDGLYLHFSDAQAVTDFLPSGGSARPLDESYDNPSAREVKNVLASQVLGLCISIEVGKANLGYGKIGRALLTEDGTTTVEQVLNYGINILTNGANTGDHTAASINEILTAINESYVDGEDQGTFYVERPN